MTELTELQSAIVDAIADDRDATDAEIAEEVGATRSYVNEIRHEYSEEIDLRETHDLVAEMEETDVDDKEVETLNLEEQYPETPEESVVHEADDGGDASDLEETSGAGPKVEFGAEFEVDGAGGDGVGEPAREPFRDSEPLVDDSSTDEGAQQTRNPEMETERESVNMEGVESEREEGDDRRSKSLLRRWLDFFFA